MSNIVKCGVCKKDVVNDRIDCSICLISYNNSCFETKKQCCQNTKEEDEEVVVCGLCKKRTRMGISCNVCSIPYHSSCFARKKQCCQKLNRESRENSKVNKGESSGNERKCGLCGERVGQQQTVCEICSILYHEKCYQNRKCCQKINSDWAPDGVRVCGLCKKGTKMSISCNKCSTPYHPSCFERKKQCCQKLNLESGENSKVNKGESSGNEKKCGLCGKIVGRQQTVCEICSILYHEKCYQNRKCCQKINSDWSPDGVRVCGLCKKGTKMSISCNKCSTPYHPSCFERKKQCCQKLNLESGENSKVNKGESSGNERKCGLCAERVGQQQTVCEICSILYHEKCYQNRKCCQKINSDWSPDGVRVCGLCKKGTKMSISCNKCSTPYHPSCFERKKQCCQKLNLASGENSKVNKGESSGNERKCGLCAERVGQRQTVCEICSILYHEKCYRNRKCCQEDNLNLVPNGVSADNKRAIYCKNCKILITIENACFLCKQCHNGLYNLKKQYLQYEDNDNVRKEEEALCGRCQTNGQFCVICVQCHDKCCTLLNQEKCDFCKTVIKKGIKCPTCQTSYHINCYKFNQRCCKKEEPLKKKNSDYTVQLCVVCKDFVKIGDVTGSCNTPYHERCYSLKKYVCKKCVKDENNNYVQNERIENLHVALINAQSLLKVSKKNVFEYFSNLLQELLFDVVCITESWLKPKKFKEDIEIAGYSFLRSDRLGERRGGLLIYYKNHLNCEEIDLQINALKVEQLWCSLKIGKFLVAIGLIYKRPIANYEKILQVKNSLDNLPKHDVTILMGDFNVDFMPKKVTRQHTTLKSITSNLYQIVYDITRESLKRPGEGTIIDHIYCDRIEICEKVCILDLGFSDHRLIDCSFNLANLALH